MKIGRLPLTTGLAAPLAVTNPATATGPTAGRGGHQRQGRSCTPAPGGKRWDGCEPSEYPPQLALNPVAYGYDTAWNTGASTWILRSGCPAALAPTAVDSPACGGFGDLASNSATHRREGWWGPLGLHRITDQPDRLRVVALPPGVPGRVTGQGGRGRPHSRPAVGLLITGCDGGRRPWPRTQVRSDQPNRASTGAAYTSKTAAVTVTAYRFCTCRCTCICKAYAPRWVEAPTGELATGPRMPFPAGGRAREEVHDGPTGHRLVQRLGARS